MGLLQLYANHVITLVSASPGKTSQDCGILGVGVRRDGVDFYCKPITSNRVELVSTNRDVAGDICCGEGPSPVHLKALTKAMKAEMHLPAASIKVSPNVSPVWPPLFSGRRRDLCYVRRVGHIYIIQCPSPKEKTEHTQVSRGQQF